jgi:hypothetical protein
VDVENKVGAYLIENNEYQIWIYSDNHPPYFKGLYSADIAGTKYITLGTFSPEQESPGDSFNKNVKYYLYLTNDSQNSTFMNFFYNDSSENTNSINLVITDVVTGAVRYTSTFTNVSEMMTQINVTQWMNNSNKITFTADVAGFSTYSSIKTFGNSLLQISRSIFQYVGENWMNWFILLLICSLAIMGTVKSGNILNLIVCGAAAVFVFVFHWWQLNVGVLILCAIIALLTFLKSREKEAYYT